jgi:hypothetical protein
MVARKIKILRSSNSAMSDLAVNTFAPVIIYITAQFYYIPANINAVIQAGNVGSLQ